MAKKGREAAAKRAREVRRAQQKVDKQERRDAARSAEPDEVVNETALMEEFALLSERLANDQVTPAEYAEEKHRIFVALGLESEEG